MPDLDQLIDTFVTDVGARSRAPGAMAAIKQAHRRRTRVAALALAAVAFIAVGGGLAAGALGGSDRTSPIEEPTTPSPTSAQDSTEPPRTFTNLWAALYPIVSRMPGWADIGSDDPAPGAGDYAFNGDCAGNWGKGAVGGHDGGLGIGAPGWTDGPGVGLGGHRFPTQARATNAADIFIDDLLTCDKVAWRTQPIAQTGGVLAYTTAGVVWIQQHEDRVEVLQVPTPHGPPPQDVQVEVAEWLVDYMAMMNEQSD